MKNIMLVPTNEGMHIRIEDFDPMKEGTTGSKVSVWFTERKYAEEFALKLAGEFFGGVKAGSYGVDTRC